MPNPQQDPAGAATAMKESGSAERLRATPRKVSNASEPVSIPLRATSHTCPDSLQRSLRSKARVTVSLMSVPVTDATRNTSMANGQGMSYPATAVTHPWSGFGIDALPPVRMDRRTGSGGVRGSSPAPQGQRLRRRTRRRAGGGPGHAPPRIFESAGPPCPPHCRSVPAAGDGHEPEDAGRPENPGEGPMHGAPGNLGSAGNGPERRPAEAVPALTTTGRCNTSAQALHRPHRSSAISRRCRQPAGSGSLRPSSARPAKRCRRPARVGGRAPSLYAGGLPEQSAHAPDMRGRFQATLPGGDRSGSPRSPRADRSRRVPAAGGEERRQGPDRGRRRPLG